MRFWNVFWEAWKNRHTMGDEHQTRELAAFLPAALEIQHAPPNPLAKWLVRTLITLFTLAVIWAAFGEVNIVASAEGKIIPSSRVKQIQPLEKAVVKAILVTEGQTVEQGQALIELDSALTNADENRLSSEQHSAELQLAIKQGLLQLLERTDQQNKAKVTFDTIDFQCPETATESERRLHKKQLWQQWQQYQAQRHNLQSNLIETTAQQAGSKALINKFKQTLPIISKRASTMKGLYDKKLIAETEYLLLEQQRIEQTQDLVAERHRLKQLKASENGIKEQLNTLTAQTKGDTLTQMTDLQRQLSSLQEELIKATDLNAKQILYAPVSGQVQELTINTVGGVVMEAQQLMLIVPNEEQLEVEVFLENQDIGFVHEGMDAEIKIHTFPFTKYGMIDGEITTISNDATVDEQRGLIYGMHLLMKKSTIMVDKREVRLMPGMAVTAEVKTGTRRIIEFFLAPLLRYKQESIRER
ncbi:HlyD family type I secretion periplasmic adaptor subunit [Pseudomonadota bacterium]|nr:HlyD family type I secretion periplasmic adaptor subunit [Pseudomonadota bacterium]